MNIVVNTSGCSFSDNASIIGRTNVNNVSQVKRIDANGFEAALINFGKCEVFISPYSGSDIIVTTAGGAHQCTIRTTNIDDAILLDLVDFERADIKVPKSLTVLFQ